MFEKIKNILKKDYPVAQVLSPYLQNKPVWSDWNTEKAVKEGFKASTWVYACVWKRMKAIASIPWKVEILKKDTWEEDPSHPLKMLLDKPNSAMSLQDLIERLIAHLDLGGNGIWYKIFARKNGLEIPVELWPLPPDGIKPVPSSENFISRYEYSYQGVRKNFEPKEILHIMYIDPSNVYWGMSPLMAGAKAVDTDVDAANWNKVALQNRAIADGVFAFKGNLTKEQYERAKQLIKEQHQGYDNARAPWVLGNDATWQQMSLSPAEMDFINSRKMTAMEICGIYQVPPPMIGLTENTPYANMKEARKIFWLDTIIPVLEDLKSAFNLGLASDFGEGVRINYDLSNVDALRADMAELVGIAKSLFDMGVPFNEINKKLELGFDEFSWGNEGYIPANYLPVGMAGERLEEEKSKELLEMEMEYLKEIKEDAENKV